MRYAVLAVFLLGLGCSRPEPKKTAVIIENPRLTPPAKPHVQSPPPETVYPKDELEFAVLAAVRVKLGEDIDTSNVRSLGSGAKRAIERQSRELDCIGEWALKLPNQQLRESYLSWVAHFRGSLESAKKELETPEAPDTFAQTQATIRRSRQLKIPTPKDCKQ